MMCVGKSLFRVLAGLMMLCTSAGAVTAESSANPYQVIVDRNVFGLKPPTPVEVVEPPKAPPPKIMLTGITTFGGKRALMKTILPAKPGDQAKEQFLTLKEGQREGEIEVLEIDEKASTVKVNDYGTIITITFEKETPKPGAPVVAAAAPNVPPPRIPLPGGFAGSKQPFSGRMGVTPPSQPGQPAPTAALGAMPPPTAQPNPQVATPQPAIPPEAQAVIDEIEKERLKGQVQGLPPQSLPQ